MTVCRATTKSSSTVLDQTKPPVPVWRCSSGRTASRAFARCWAASTLGASAATRLTLPRSLHLENKTRSRVETLVRCLKSRQHNPALRLVLPLLVLIAHFTIFIEHKEDHLAQTVIRINLRR